MEIIVKKDISHYNRALGKQINSRREYRDEMKRQGMVSFEEGKDIARKAKERDHKDYKPDRDTMGFLNSLKSKDGKVKLGGRALDFMESKGVSFKRPKERPLEGGWE